MSDNILKHEEIVRDQILEKFPFLGGKVTVQRARRILADLPYEKFQEFLEFTIKDGRFTMLCAMTGMDEGESLSVIYHFSEENGTMLNVKISVPKNNPVIHTITDRFPAADAYERELIDLLGFSVEGLKAGNRYPLPDSWPKDSYPLRKDWKPDTVQKAEGA